jgi:ATP/ADP translocase
MEIEPTTSEMEEMSPKQIIKPRNWFTPLNITIIVAVIAIVGFGTFYFLNTEKEIDIKGSINQSHGKII